MTGRPLRNVLLALSALLAGAAVACGRAPSIGLPSGPPLPTPAVAALPPVVATVVAPGADALPTPVVTPPPGPAATPTLTPSPPPAPTPRPTETATASAPPADPLPLPYTGLSIEELRARPYGEGRPLRVERVLEENGAFTRSLISYESDGLTVYGFMNAPPGEGPFPVVVVLHGYVDPATYDTLAYTAPYADALAEAGFLVLHPNYRNHPPSGEGPNPFRVGYAVDALNLIAQARRLGGRPGPLQAADPGDISLWGHSMGGGVALRVLAVDPNIRAAVLYASMSADETANFERIRYWSDGREGDFELGAPPEIVGRIAPAGYLGNIEAAVGVHHGTADVTVPYTWSYRLCEELEALGKTVECYFYKDQPHLFTGAAELQFRERMTGFLLARQ